MKQNKKPFGFYAPNFTLKTILCLVKMGLGAGKLKTLFSKAYDVLCKKTPVDITYTGLKLRVYPQGNTIENKILFSSATREQAEIQALKSLLTPKSTFLDIGANMGYYSLNAAKLGAKKVLSVEPNPKILPRLKDNIAFNGFENIIKIAETCLGEKNENLTLTVCDQDMGSSSAVSGKVSGERITVKSMPLEALLKQESIAHVDAIKIDVEGMEDRVLFPYFKTLKKDHYPAMIIIEDNSDLWQKNILKWLLENGYTVSKKTRGNLILRHKK